MLDTGAHFYDAYECADGEYISIGSIEPQFYAELLRLTGLDGDAGFADQHDRAAWPALKVALADLFRTKTRDEWCAVMEHTDVCFAPVLRLDEAPQHPAQCGARRRSSTPSASLQPAPAPRFSRTVPELSQPPAHDGQHTREVLLDWGVAPDRVERPDRRPAP